jgi:hypothetical protein
LHDDQGDGGILVKCSGVDGGKECRHARLDARELRILIEDRRGVECLIGLDDPLIERPRSSELGHGVLRLAVRVIAHIKKRLGDARPKFHHLVFLIDEGICEDGRVLIDRLLQIAHPR